MSKDCVKFINVLIVMASIQPIIRIVLDFKNIIYMNRKNNKNLKGRPTNNDSC